MSSPNLAYQRILRSGYDLEIVRANHCYILRVTRDGRRVHALQAPRIGRLTIQEVRAKCRAGKWRSDSRTLSVLNRLAALCESLAAKEAK